MPSVGNAVNCGVVLVLAVAVATGCTSTSKRVRCDGGSCASTSRPSVIPSVTADPLPTYSGPARVMSLKSVAAVGKVNPTVACSIFAGTPTAVSIALFGGRPLHLVVAKSVGPAGEVRCAYSVGPSSVIDLTVVARPNTDHVAAGSQVTAAGYRATSPAAQVIVTSSSAAILMTAPAVKAFADRMLLGISL
jgi:hypothetical protein